jgi:FkbM family methyltransferase
VPLTPPDAADLDRRIALTAAVTDTDDIPKVDGAGEVRDHGGRRVQVMHNGVLVEEDCYGGPFETEIIRRLRGHHEPQEERVFHALVERIAAGRGDEPPAMVELGAYWAYYSLWFAHALPGARTIMVEPDPNNLDVGRRNFALNGLDGAFVHAAVGGEDGGEMWLPCESDGRTRRVPTVTLDGLMRDHGLDRLDLVLCDTQGAELLVLESARDVLAAGRVRFLVISTHHQIFSGDPLTHQRCLAFLEDLGAQIVAEHTIRESCSGDGLIVASMDPADRGFTVPITHVRARDSVFGEPEFELSRAEGWAGPVRRYGGRVLGAIQQRRRRVGG